MQIADANIVLRYVLDDHPQLSPQAADILENNEVRVPFEIVCEVVYVLQKVYAVPREKIRAKIKDLLVTHLINTEKPVILQQALDMYCERNLDFVDAILFPPQFSTRHIHYP